jgi:hypothetical protein
VIARMRRGGRAAYRGASSLIESSLGILLFVGGVFVVYHMANTPSALASVSLLLGFAGAGTAAAGGLLALGVRRELALETLTALAAGSFALDLALISSKPETDVVATTAAPMFWLACLFLLHLFEPEQPEQAAHADATA